MPKLLIASTIALTQRAFLLPFARYLRARNWQVDGMSAGITGCELCKLAFDHVYDVSWSRNPLDPQNLVRAIRQVRNIVHSEGYEIVHVHTPVASFILRYALRNWHGQGKLKIVYTAHGFHFYRGGRWANNAAFLMLEKLAGRWTDYLVVINREDEEVAKRHRIVRPKRVWYVPGVGIDLEHYQVIPNASETIANVRTELSLQPEQRLFLMVAAFDPGKRHRDVIRALSLIKRPDIVVAFAGTGPLQEKVLGLARSLGVSDQLRFLGFRDDIPTLMQASIATLLPSEREGLPRSVMESMALGIPVIGADTRGTRDLLKGGAGIVVPVGDASALAQAILNLHHHPEEARWMGDKGRQDVQKYQLGTILSLHEALYLEALR